MSPVAKPADNHRPSVLIVDDEISNIETLHAILERSYEVYFATDGLQGFQKALELAPDLLLLDIEMPNMDGYQLSKLLTEDPSTKEIPFLFVSARDDVADQVKGFRLGAADYITKPFEAAIVEARVATHIRLKRQSDALRAIADLDGLTRLPNRRKFDEVFAREWKRGLRQGSTLALLLIDVDYFKRYNDHYGHLAGDDCLKEVACALAGVAHRPGDLAARYGGEEFALILPDTDAEGARHIAEQARQALRELALPHAASEVAERVTASIGVAAALPADEHFERLIGEADEALYRAKEGGRDRMAE